MQVKDITSELSGARWIGASALSQSPIITRKFTLCEALFPQVKGMHSAMEEAAECSTDVEKPETVAFDGAGAELLITGLGYFEAYINGKKVTENVLTPLPSDYLPRNLEAFAFPLTDELTHRIYVCRYDVSALLQPGENTLTIQLGNGWFRQMERYITGDVIYGDVLRTIYKLQIGEETIVSDGSETWQNSHLTYNNLFIGEVWNMVVTDKHPKPVQVLEDLDVPLCEEIGAPDKVIRKISPKLVYIIDDFGKSYKGGSENAGNAFEARCKAAEGQRKLRKIYDVGENISGVVQVRTKALRGQRVVLRFAEELTTDGQLDVFSSGGQYLCRSERLQTQTDVFINDGEERVFTPKFVWHAFRYFEVQGEVEELTVLEIHSDTPVKAEFKSSSEGMNFLYEAFLRTQLGNMHGSFPSDCPHRERLGYTGDGQLCAAAAMRMLDAKTFYQKWIQDILDCQNIKNGHIQHTAPFAGGGGGPGGWGSSVVIVPYEYYKQYGDVEILKQAYPQMCFFIEYLLNRMEDGLVTHEEGGGWCLGDWCTLESCVIPPAFVNTYYLVKCLQILQEIEGILGISEKPQEMISSKCVQKMLNDRCTPENMSAVNRNYVQLEQEIKAHMIRHFRDEDGHFCGGIQGADAYAIDLGLCEFYEAQQQDKAQAGEAKCLEDAEANRDVSCAYTLQLVNSLAEKYDRLGHLDTGHYGTKVLFDVLFRYGKENTILRLLESKEAGSFLFMKEKGATTIWEEWGGPNSHWAPGTGSCSHFHPVFGSPAYHMLSSVLGITQEEDSAGYDRLLIEPHIPQGLDHAEGYMDTEKGRVEVSYKLIKGSESAETKSQFNIRVPEHMAYEEPGAVMFRFGGVCRELQPGVNELMIAGNVIK